MKKILIAGAVLVAAGAAGYVALNKAVPVDQEMVLNTFESVFAKTNQYDYDGRIDVQSRVNEIRDENGEVFVKTEHMATAMNDANSSQFVFFLDHQVSGTIASVELESTYSEDSPHYEKWKEFAGGKEPLVLTYSGSPLRGKGVLNLASMVVSDANEEMRFDGAEFEFSHGFSGDEFALNVSPLILENVVSGETMLKLDGITAEGQVDFVGDVPVFPGESVVEMKGFMFSEPGSREQTTIEAFSIVGTSELSDGKVSSSGNMRISGVELPETLKQSFGDIDVITAYHEVSNIPVEAMSKLGQTIQTSQDEQEITNAFKAFFQSADAPMNGEISIDLGSSGAAGLNAAFTVDPLNGLNGINPALAINSLLSSLSLHGGYHFEFDPNTEEGVMVAQTVMMTGFGVLESANRVSGKISVTNGNIVMPTGQTIPLAALFQQGTRW